MRNIFKRKEKGTTYIITEMYVNEYSVIKERVIKSHTNFDIAVEYLKKCRDINPNGNYYIIINHVN